MKLNELQNEKISGKKTNEQRTQVNRDYAQEVLKQYDYMGYFLHLCGIHPVNKENLRNKQFSRAIMERVNDLQVTLQAKPSDMQKIDEKLHDIKQKIS